MAEKTLASSYSALVWQIVQASHEPLTFREILERVEQLRPIATRSPEQTIRNAIGACALIVNTGDGRFGWFPRLLQSARVRVMLHPPELKSKHIVFGNEVRDLLWPAFFANQALRDQSPIRFHLPTGLETMLPLNFFGEGVWGTEGTTALWQWLAQNEPVEGDALLIEAINAEGRDYRVSLERQSERDETVVAQRTIAVEKIARELLWKRRRHRTAIWELGKPLLVAGCYQHPMPPASLVAIWSRVVAQVELVEVARAQRKTKLKPARQVYQLRIRLDESPVPIWRQVQVADNTTLEELHWIIQFTFGWTNSHLHQFLIGGETYSDLRLGLEEAEFEVRDEQRRTVEQLAQGEPVQFRYEYDFGDGWHHTIEVEQVLPVEKNKHYPVCLAGERAGPPEDCGGVWGYANLLNAVDNVSHPEHEELREWVGEGFAPERCDLVGINWQLEKYAAAG